MSQVDDAVMEEDEKRFELTEGQLELILYAIDNSVMDVEMRLMHAKECGSKNRIQGYNRLLNKFRAVRSIMASLAE